MFRNALAIPGPREGPSRRPLLFRRALALLAALLAASALLAAPGTAAGLPDPAPGQSFHPTDLDHPAYVPGQVIVKFRAGSGIILPEGPEEGWNYSQGIPLTGVASLDRLARTFQVTGIEKIARNRPKTAEGAELRARLGIDRIALVRYASPMDASDVARAYAADPAVQWAEPNYLGTADGLPDETPDLIPNDTHFNLQWGLRNTAQTPPSHPGSAKVDGDIDATDAWDIATGSSDVIVAILDSGIDWDHPDLDSRIWANPGETAGNGLDDDGNGYVDDIRGWDCVNEDNNPDDDLGHGSNVAGIVGAESNNSQEVAGVDWACKLMPVKVIDAGNNFTDANLLQGMTYAADERADVVNLSLGGPYSQTKRDAVDYAYGVGCFLVASMGNDNSSINRYPAAFEKKVFSVGATDTDDWRANPFSWGGGSNYGDHIDVVAPGNKIHSTYKNAGHSDYSGTSQAAPHVSGLAALLLGTGKLSGGMMEHRIRGTAEDRVGKMPAEDKYGWDKYMGFGRINAYTAVNIPNVVVTLYGNNPSDSIARGDTLDLDAVFCQTAPAGTYSFDYWAVALTPGGIVRAVAGPDTVSTTPWWCPVKSYHHRIPARAPLSNYTYIGYIGDYPSTIWDKDVFKFTVVASEAGQPPRLLVERLDDLPAEGALSQCAPNPFIASTTIRYRVEPGLPVSRGSGPFEDWPLEPIGAAEGPLTAQELSGAGGGFGEVAVSPAAAVLPVSVRLTIYNLRGETVRHLIDEPKLPGAYSVRWDGSSESGQKVSAGVYFYHLRVGVRQETRKIVLRQ